MPWFRQRGGGSQEAVKPLTFILAEARKAICVWRLIHTYLSQAQFQEWWAIGEFELRFWAGYGARKSWSLYLRQEAGLPGRTSMSHLLQPLLGSKHRVQWWEFLSPSCDLGKTETEGHVCPQFFRAPLWGMWHHYPYRQVEGRSLDHGPILEAWCWSNVGFQSQGLQHGEGRDNPHTWIVGTSFLSHLHHQAHVIFRQKNRVIWFLKSFRRHCEHTFPLIRTTLLIKGFCISDTDRLWVGSQKSSLGQWLVLKASTYLISHPLHLLKCIILHKHQPL